MTRINCIPVNYLSDKHLNAEYFEMPRIATALEKKSPQALHSLKNDPARRYVLGAGHVTFFYTRLLFIRNRFSELFLERIDRGVNVDIEGYQRVTKRFAKLCEDHPNLNHSWSVTHEACIANLQRLVEKEPLNQTYSGLLNHYQSLLMTP